MIVSNQKQSLTIKVEPHRTAVEPSVYI